MAIDLEARNVLRNALVDYMTGKIRTYAFDDCNSSFQKATDDSLRQISRFLWTLHDGLIDHPISVTAYEWEMLRRIVAFLGMDLEIETGQDNPTWPFCDEKQWLANEYLLDNFKLPDYDSETHGQPANPWWNRIPSSVGFALLACILAVLFVVIVLS